MEIDREYLGQLLLEQGFKTWFLYMFRVLEGRPFKVEPIHEDMFQLAQDVLDQKITRANENVPPRSAKTTMCKYIVLYTFTVNPKDSKIVWRIISAAAVGLSYKWAIPVKSR